MTLEDVAQVEPKTIILPGQKTNGLPGKAKTLNVDTMSKILVTPWYSDVHFVQYSVIEALGPYRYNNGIFKLPEFEGQVIRMCAVAFDVDSPAKKSAVPGAIDEWWENEKPKIAKLMADLPGGLVWRTKGGWRGIWAQDRILASLDDTSMWRKDYLAAIIRLDRVYGIQADPACSDWNRLHRVPLGIRDDEAKDQEPTRRETIGIFDPHARVVVSSLSSSDDRDEARRRFLSAWKAPSKVRQLTPAADVPHQGPLLVGDSVWARILKSRGALGRELAAGKYAVPCPNVAHHTTAGNETSTVFYEPGHGEVLGHIFCAHHHCQNADWKVLFGVTTEEWSRTLAEVVATVPKVDIVETQETPIPADEQWYTDGVVWLNGQIEPSPGNIAHILTHHPFWKGRLGYDTFKQERVWRNLPRFLSAQHSHTVSVLDLDTIAIQHWFLRGSEDGNIKLQQMRVSIENARLGVVMACASNSFSSLRESVLVNEGIWDGTPRLDSWLIDYMSAADTPLNRAIGARWLISAVARALTPGCVADFMVILEGKQEIGKNYLLDIMFGHQFISVPQGLVVGSKDFDQKTSASWCVHDDELTCTKRAGLEEMKMWLTQRTANFRKAFDRDFVTVPRPFIVVGSTNHAKYLKDDENRRFWPITLGKLKAVELVYTRNQLWSEAIAYFRTGKEYRIMKNDPLWGALDDVHDQKKVEDPYVDAVRAILASGQVKMPFLLHDVLMLMNIPIEKHKYENVAVTNTLRKLGYHSRRTLVGDERRIFWHRETQ